MFLAGFSVPLMVIQTVNLNSKFRSFLVRILVQEDNTENKVLKMNFIQKKQERDWKDKVQQIFSTICRKLIWESVWETRFFEFEYFSFILLKSFRVH